MRLEDHCDTRLLDTTLDRLHAGDFGPALDRLYDGLLRVRRTLPAREWRQFVDQAVAHPLRSHIHRDPMTRRSFEKPRGYAGDAVLLDFIYGLRAPEERDPIAAGVYGHAAGRPAARAVRGRRDRIARLIDRVAEQRGHPIRVLSIAAGHLREAELSHALADGSIEEFVALDSDAESCQEIRSRFPRVDVHNCSFVNLLRERAFDGRFDLVYSAGLFDYLEERTARRLTRRMFEMLRPEGTLLLTNFMPTTPDIGYMESYMGWDLILRDELELFDLAQDVPVGEARERRTDADEDETIAYLEVERR